MAIAVTLTMDGALIVPGRCVSWGLATTLIGALPCQMVAISATETSVWLGHLLRRTDGHSRSWKMLGQASTVSGELDNPSTLLPARLLCPSSCPVKASFSKLALLKKCLSSLNSLPCLSLLPLDPLHVGEPTDRHSSSGGEVVNPASMPCRH